MGSSVQSELGAPRWASPLRDKTQEQVGKFLSPELAAIHYKFALQVWSFPKCWTNIYVFSPQTPAFVSVRAVKGCAKAAVVRAPSGFAADVLVVGEIMTFS